MMISDNERRALWRRIFELERRTNALSEEIQDLMEQHQLERLNDEAAKNMHSPKRYCQHCGLIFEDADEIPF